MTGKRILLGTTGVVVLGILGWYQVVSRPEAKPEPEPVVVPRIDPGKNDSPVIPDFQEDDAAPRLKAAADWLDGINNGILKSRDNRLRQDAAEMRKAEEQLQQLLPLLNAEYLVGENQYFDAKAKLDQQAPLLERHLKDRRLDALTLADSLAILELGRICSLVGQYDQGREYALLGLQAQARLSAANPLLIGNLIQAELVVANVLARGHNPHEALPHAQKALSLCQEKKRFFTSAWQTELEGCARLTLAEVYQATGAYNASLAEVEQALVVLHQRFPPGEDYPKGHLLLANALQTQASTLVLLGRSVEARPIQEQALTQLENHLRPGHPTRAQAYLNMTALALLQGDPHLAGERLNEASRELAICFPEKLFPEGHPVLFQLRNTQANLDNQMGKAKEALQPLEDNWQKCQQFYKKPRGEKVLTLLAYAAGLRQADQFEKALAASQQALTLAADLPGSWPCDRYRSLCLVQIGDVLAALKRYDEALDSLAQAEKLQPKDNPEQPTILSCRAWIALQQQNYVRAQDQFLQLLATQLQEVNQFGAFASTAETFAFSRRVHATLDGLLSASRHLPETRAQVYAQVWVCKGILTRMLQARRRILGLASSNSEEVRKIGSQLLDLHSQLGQLTSSLQKGIEQRESKRNDLLLQIENLERERNTVVKLPRTDPSLANPSNLIAALPDEVAFVDLVRYEDLAIHPVPQRYVAFVVLKGKAAEWIDLGPAGPIDDAVDTWHPTRPFDLAVNERFTGGKPPTSKECLATLSKLVWNPISGHLTPGIKTLYLATDGDLARFPFVVLPGKENNKILLEEDLLIGYVPHGPFLLEQLKSPPPAPMPNDPLFILANVSYGKTGKKRELFEYLKTGPMVIDRLRTLAGERPSQILQGEEATPKAFREHLAQARMAYIATHGYFKEKELNEEMQRWQDRLHGWTFTSSRSLEQLAPLLLGQRSPLAYTGLALRDANRSEQGILSGDVIAELELDQLRLVILSSCMTGLGKHTVGEGVQAIQRAFHLAGSPNVVASLWETNAIATDVLLEEFCAQMWKTNKSPLRALRDAQRELYYHFEWTEKGRELSRSIAFNPSVPNDDQRTPYQWWAGFVLSGLGQ